MNLQRTLLIGIVAYGTAGILSAQSPILTSIETPPYPHLQSSVTIAGISYVPGAVAYSPISATLILHGSNFGASGTVRFLGYKYINSVRTLVSTTQVQLTAPSWQSTSIVVSVPSIAETGTIQVANSNGMSSELPFFISQGSLPASCPVITPLRITTTSLPDGVVGQAYSSTLAATGGTQPYSWSIISGTLPSGISLNATTGVISGTPTTSTGTPIGITVQVVDSNSPQGTTQTALNITINSGVNLGSQYSYCISAAPDSTCSNPTGGYDADGNVISFYDSVIGTWNLNNGYDSLNRITSATATGPAYEGLQASWSYNAFGNRLTENFSGTAYSGHAAVPASTSFTYDTNNRINGVLSGYAPHYDAAGNLQCEEYRTDVQPNSCAVGAGGNIYLYDGEGRVCAVSSASGMFGYLYNAEGTRIAKGTIRNFTCDTNPAHPAYNQFAMSTSYILGPGSEQVTELNWNGSTAIPAHSNVFAGGQLIATYTFNPDQNAPSPGTISFHLTDWVGTRRALFNYAGVIQQICDSLPFGNGEDCLPTPTEHLFTGKERDQESGNDYFGARYYSSSMGRWLSPDWSAKVVPVPYAKLDNPQSLNLYNYVLNNPLTGIDLDGHVCIFGHGSTCNSWKKTIDGVPRGQTVNIVLNGITGLHFHPSLPSGAFNNSVSGVTSSNTVQVKNGHVWPGFFGGATGSPSSSQVSTAEKAMDYAFSTGHQVATIGYSNGVAAQGVLARDAMAQDRSFSYSLSVEPNTSLGSLTDISNASALSQTIRATNDPVLNSVGILGSASASAVQSLASSESFMTNTGTHNWQANVNAAIDMNGGNPLGPSQ